MIDPDKVLLELSIAINDGTPYFGAYIAKVTLKEAMTLIQDAKVKAKFSSPAIVSHSDCG